MRVLVLGSEGCVGSSVYRFFKEKGHDVIGWDIKNGEEYDLRKPGVLDDILPNVDFVIFLAFDVGGSKYNVHSLQYMNNNLNIIMHTMTSLAKFKKPFIYSTSQMSNMNNNSYAVLKRLSEFYTELSGGINVKLWNVYGGEPISEKSHVVPDFIAQAVSNGKIQMRTEGKEERMFLYCDDFSDAIYTIFENYSKFLGNGIIDVSGKEWITVRQLADVVKEVVEEKTGKVVEIFEGNYIDTFHNRKNEPIPSLLDTLWSPKISLRDGIKSIMSSFL